MGRCNCVCVGVGGRAGGGGGGVYTSVDMSHCPCMGEEISRQKTHTCTYSENKREV